MRKIIISKNSGFCFGVKRAIEIANESIGDTSNKGVEDNSIKEAKIYTLGPLIHNKIVIDELKSKGVDIIDDLNSIEEGSTVIIRSHGEKKSVYDKAKEKSIIIKDATCPFVERIHNLVNEAHDKNHKILIIGNPTHPEVIGINGWCDNSATVINSGEEAEKIRGNNYFVVCQTTLRKELLEDIQEIFKENQVAFELVNTICSATKKRQDSCLELSKEVDAMVIIGDKNSSNSKKLFEIASKNCKNSYFCENIADLPLQELKKYYKIGVAAGASTPESVIKEVIANMSEKALEANEKNLMEDFMEEIDASLKLPRVGDIVDGKVHMVTDDEVIVNMGCKKDGILPASQVSMEEGQKLSDLFKEGDEVQAKVVKSGDDDGGILLSKKSLEVLEHWDELNSALENKEVIKVKVLRTLDSGVIAGYKDIDGFIPMSQLSLKYIESSEEFAGQELDVRVIRADRKRHRAIFSRKAALREERKKQIEELWSTLHEGDIVEGKVMRFADFGAFIDLGGIDGLLHISEISWGKLKHPKEVLNLGDVVKVKILSMNDETGKISLGLKQITPEPWSIIDEKLAEGEYVKGKIVQLKEYGAFVEIEPGLDGLVHISEIANRRVENTSELLSVGQEVEAKVIGIDYDNRRISLSLRDTLEVPENEEENYPEEAEEHEEE